MKVSDGATETQKWRADELYSLPQQPVMPKDRVGPPYGRDNM